MKISLQHATYIIWFVSKMYFFCWICTIPHAIHVWHIYFKNQPKVSKYAIHGRYGYLYGFPARHVMKTQEQRQNLWSFARFVGCTIGTLHGTTSITGMGSLWEDEKGTFVHKKNVGTCWNYPPPRMPVTTRFFPFLVGNPYKPSFVTVTGWGVDRRKKTWLLATVPWCWVGLLRYDVGTVFCLNQFSCTWLVWWEFEYVYYCNIISFRDSVLFFKVMINSAMLDNPDIACPSKTDGWSISSSWTIPQWNL